MLWSFPALLLAASLGPSGDAVPKVVVLDPVLEGEVDETREQELLEALRSGLSRGEFELLPTPPTVECAPAEGQPWTTECASAAASAVGAEFAVSMRIALDRRDYSIELEVIDAKSAEVSGSSSERCEVCGIAEARDVVDNQAAAIRARIESLTLAPPVIAFESTPPGALIRFDGKVVGEAPFERVVEPGPHQVEATLDGYVAETQNLEAVKGVQAKIAFELEPVPRSVRFRKLRIFGWAALGVGVAGVATGITLIALDGRPNRFDCDGSNVDPDGDCKFVYGTMAGGIGAAVAGGVLLATGIGIIVGTRDKDRKGSKAKAQISPAVSPGLRSATFGLRGRF